MSDAALTQALEARFGSGSFRPLSGRGNSRVGVWQSAETYFVKHYPVDAGWNRRAVEAQVIGFYAANGITAIPQLLHSDDAHNYSVFSFIDGTPEYAVDDNAFTQLLQFIERIMLLPHGHTDIGAAKESFFHTSTLRSHIDKRYAFLRAVDDPQLQAHFATQFEPALARAHYATLTDIACGEETIISPSDFGTHNSLRTADGRLYFIDFEYGGRDSKYKLLADIYWHPGSALNQDQRAQLIAPFLENAKERMIFEQVRLMMGLKWSLLVLNEFLSGQIEKRQRAMQTTESAEEIKKRQLAKSRQILDKASHG